jgi:hypothetical protein
MSVNDLATIGHSIGFSPTLDNTKSMKYNAAYNSATAAVACSGNGLTNNRPYGGIADNQSAFSTIQNTAVGNACGQYKCGKYYDTTTGNNANGIVGSTGSIVTAANLVLEFRPYYEVKNNYMVWYDFAVIKLSHLFESLGKMGLVRRFDATLRLWVNTGTVAVTVDSPATTTANYSLTPSNNSFSNTCPLLVNYIPSTSTVGIPATTANIVAGLYIAKPPSTSYGNGINLSNSGVAHPLGNCRLYYSQIMLDPQKSITYTNTNLNKKIVYTTFVSNQYNNIPSMSSFNQLINSGIVHPTGILIVPFIGTQLNVGLGDSQWKSPFDTCPATTSPCSLTNLSVAVGGSNVLQSTLFYTYENFLEQVNLAEQLTSSDFGVSTGLISQGYWEWSRWYYVNVERSQATDKKQPRNVNISFNNNSSVPIDCLVFIFYSDELVINVETGIIEK